MKILYPQIVEGHLTKDLSPLAMGEDFQGLELTKYISGECSQFSRSCLIAVEGIDGSGKTTLAHQLARSLSEVFNEAVLLTAEPAVNYREGLKAVDWIYPIDAGDCSEFPCQVAQSMQRRLEAMRLSMDHAIHLGEVVIPALNRGMIVVTDRWYYSSLCYQVERLAEIGDPEPRPFINHIHQGWDLNPDLTIFLSIPPEEAVKRLEARSRESGTKLHMYEEKDFLTRVALRYSNLSMEKQGESWSILDGSSPQKEILFQAMDPAINRVLARRGKG